jgi:hypothetical protein
MSANAGPSARPGPQGPVQVTQIMVMQNVTLIDSNIGRFWIDHDHGGYTSIFRLLLACLNSPQKPGAVSLVRNGKPETLGAEAEVDWFRWPG